ncbi:cytochrome b [Undibacterium piscinae]|uniref:Cytochrome b n=1 Tax=Undibacterium piscinae TaxID=2495591 RepID=A0A6M4A8A9_9BURK|nr:cytochrome b [Undibacterium piscinae]
MQRYNRLSIALHWLVAILIIAAFALGSVMTDMRISPTKLQYYSWHKWLGVTVLGFVALRLLTRLFSAAPAYPAGMKTWQKRLASATHVFLYMLMFAVPMSGYFYTSAAGYPVVYLGLFELPGLIAANPELKPLLKELHEVSTTVILVVVALHLAAALKHHFIDKDGIFQRILPGK